MDYPADRIDRDAVRHSYNHVFPLEPLDEWHQYTKQQLEKFVRSNAHFFRPESLLLNVGSGGDDYGVRGHQVHIDIAESRLQTVSRSIVASAEELPLMRGSVGGAICVGSVLNYCDAAAVIREIGRVMSCGSYLLLEFESSASFEYLFTTSFARNASVANAWLNQRTERIWLYSEPYISAQLKRASLFICAVQRFHYLSALAARFGVSEKACVEWAAFDEYVARIPFIKRFASNVAYVCVKQARYARETPATVNSAR